MNLMVIDTEVTTFNKGDPFDNRNKFVLGGSYDGNNYNLFSSLDTSSSLRCIGNSNTRYVLFNAKFDLHWLRNIGSSIEAPYIWDCQLAEYILSNQKQRYPSLNDACIKYNVPTKLDVVKNEYWDKGINTDEIPTDILSEYLIGDLQCTYQVYLKQLEEFKKPAHKGKFKLFRLHCQDLLVLQEMEYNGFLYDCENSKKAGKALEEKCAALDKIILSMYPDIPLNLSSPDHISCLLYGGAIEVDDKIPIGVFKTGLRVGHTKYKNIKVQYELPKLIDPIKGSELAKDGYFSTNEDTLRNLKASGRAKTVIDTILERRGLEKLRGTYYDGIPGIIEKHFWNDSLVHGQLNQCVTITGRLSATKPNQQNMPPTCKAFCISRY